MDGADNSSAAAAFIRTAQKNIDFTFQPQPVLPGDDVTDLITAKKRFARMTFDHLLGEFTTLIPFLHNSSVKIGVGLAEPNADNRVTSSVAGKFCRRLSNICLDSSTLEPLYRY